VLLQALQVIAIFKNKKMRRPIITQAWLADFYAEGVKSKYKGSIKRQATSSKPQAQPEVASTKQQASSTKRR
jgi:hypothetical protein